MYLIVLDKENQTSVAIEIGDRGYDIFKGERVLQNSQKQSTTSQKSASVTEEKCKKQ